MMRGPGIIALLERALCTTAERARAEIAITEHRATEWHSATFSGMRHEIAVTAPSSAPLDQWLEGLSEAELPVAGHLVADMVVVAVSRGVARTGFRLEALTVATE